jgi:secreted trypsin-like serine protease
LDATVALVRRSFRAVKPVKRATPSVTTMLMAACFLLTSHGPARSLTGGQDVSPDDIGAKASVALYYRGKPFCGGVVFQDRYVLTAAHCLSDGRGNIVKSAAGIEVRYWSSEKPKHDARKVEKFTIHENLLHQERASYPTAQPGDFINFPINHEDIAVLKLRDVHPAGSISVFVPSIDNEYSAAGRTGNSTWFYVYGAAVNGSFGKLQRALVGQYGALERVVPDKPPEAFYTVRQMTIVTAEFNKNVSHCHGDSGSGVFLAKSDGGEYAENPDKLPDSIELKQGLPILVGLVSQYPVTKTSEKNARCGRDIGANAYEATRVDYYHDWIVAKTKQMQQ